MANEITIKESFSVTTSAGQTIDATNGLQTYQVDMTGKNVLCHIQTIGTSEEAITLGDIAVGGMAYFKNLDATNFVSLRQGTGASDFARLKAGETARFRIDNDMTAPYAIADTASCDLLVVIADV